MPKLTPNKQIACSIIEGRHTVALYLDEQARQYYIVDAGAVVYSHFIKASAIYRYSELVQHQLRNAFNDTNDNSYGDYFKCLKNY